MRALVKMLCAFGMIAAATAAASAQQARSPNSVQPDGGVTYDAGGAPYSRNQRSYDSSNDFQLQGLKDPANKRAPAGADSVNDKADKPDK
jgi:opacity protein-like surface antigen